MGLREHVADPWGALVAVLAGGLTWAVIPAAPLAIPLGLGVAAAVFGVKVAANALLDRRGSVEPDDSFIPATLPEAPKGSPARGWLVRAERAAHTLDELVDSAGSGATAGRLRTVRDGAAGTVTTMRRLAGQVTAFEAALGRIDARQLVEEHDRLSREVAGASSTEPRLAEWDQALGSVREQMEIYERMSSTRDTLLARMQSTALALEGLGARAAELVAMSASSGATDTAEDELVAELTVDLDAMRAGLAEVEALGRRLPEDT